jgi:SAM-dependent methyltransferase
MVELGCSRGDNAAAFAGAGGIVTGVDVDPGQVRQARQRWSGTPLLEFVHADAATFLADEQSYDVSVSIFGALSFAGPDLVGLVARRLRSGGTLAVSARLGGNVHARSAGDWASLAAVCGFTIDRWLTFPHPTDPGDAPCLVFVARSVH